MTRGGHWNETELMTAKAMFEAGESYHSIADAIGRSPMAIYDKLRSKFRLCRGAPDAYDGPPIPLTAECQAYRQDCKLGSQILREACLDHFCRIANRAGLGLDDVLFAYRNGGPAPVPGTERVYRGQGAQKALAA